MTQHPKQIFITGGTGFVGNRVIQKLSENKQYKLTILSRTRRKTLERQKNIRWISGDIGTKLRGESELCASDAIIHLASEININNSITSPRDLVQTNMNMLFEILESLRKNHKKTLIIFTSTDRLYGKTTKKTVTESDRPTPIEPYTSSKILCEILLETYQLLYGIPYIILRLDGVYGPGQPRSMFISDIIHKMITQEIIPVGNLSLKKNFVYVDDVANAILCALKAPQVAQNNIYNIGGEFTSFNKIFSIIQKILTSKLQKQIIKTADPTLNRPANIEVKPFKLSTKKAEKLLNWKQKTTLTEGLSNTINHFLANYEKK